MLAGKRVNLLEDAVIHIVEAGRKLLERYANVCFGLPGPDVINHEPGPEEHAISARVQLIEHDFSNRLVLAKTGNPLLKKRRDVAGV